MEAGRVLDDRYEILGPIAQGASSTVWEARDRGAGGEGDETVAVKVPKGPARKLNITKIDVGLE